MELGFISVFQILVSMNFLEINGQPLNSSSDDTKWKPCTAFTRRDRHYRRRSRRKPYDPVDELNLDRLVITSPTSSAVAKESAVLLSGRLDNGVSRLPAKKDSLIYPSKLNLLSHPSSVHQANTSKWKPQSQTKNCDFASLASAQMSAVELSRNTMQTSKTSDAATSYKKASFTTSSCAQLSRNVENDDEDSSFLAVEKEIGDLPVLRSTARATGLVRSCSQEAMLNEADFTAEELACYFEELVHIPKKMSEMAEMMYT